MDINEAKSLVIKAGLNLVESGLIARTWGNVSCRVDENTFVITPSGRSYNSLTPKEIVQVNMLDLSYSGNIKPSSEKGIHAQVYKLHPEINFVIHTHQENASVIAASSLDSINILSQEPFINGDVICAKYALPGTKALRKNVTKALENSETNAVIMKYHGALCFGRSYDEAFKVAEELEKACEEFIIKNYLRLSRKKSYNVIDMNRYFILQNTKEKNIIFKKENKKYLSCKKKNKLFLLYGKGKEVEVNSNDISVSSYEEAEIYDYILRNNKDINDIIFCNSSYITAISLSLTRFKPILDDFAQIAGTNVKVVNNDKVEISKALKKSPVVFIKDVGALCCGKTYDDAEAVRMVTSKTSKAYIGASLFGKVQPIKHLECMLMRYVYVKKYSKKALKK